ncbi:ABC transporter permease [Mesorhizobium sp. M2D.F.Ca.ET.185.01.1.1]|uniref:ABC transporter permease n=1 Tax=unclassified Mesorhizobium TaxID=325217 RepID=UPI000FCC8C30|nr:MULTISPECIES: ABC transporter permease [unclassified Mesorhizobium]TGP77457.1 ABC transporter permease [bacterium M00.F.Ca.ET.227.01.1.1]TGP93252.1 ABC transporter permease [bacterium M00.F.Ca.ET.222.01.1.1]TGP96798.1 ABC transporter permease [bacterium M00.F.Ca.ET.221.01.1.1]TGT96230.1 ABC transporter permease [bacterium M00.F.Ca.ET.163.01.1.1]TGU21215.1 ABC transporter permease [bacterium M00.F.Ca.ET.156.01.1.1]TGU50010.1 ABC transporter permease [bacterium M00.F.Ca.ET.146.01.1.1]TGV688
MTDIPAKAAAPSASSGSLLLTLMKLRTFIALIAVLVFFSVAVPNFFSAANLILMAKHVALNAFLAMGMTFVIVTGGIDLSVGSIVGLCGMVAGYLVLNGIDLQIGYTVYFNVVEIALVTLLVGILIGAVNGLLITRLNVAPFIATLGTLYVARGLALLSSDGRTFPNLVGKPELGTTGFGYLGAGRLLGLPVSIWILVVVALGAAYLARYTPLGRHIFAVGGNERAARISGVRVNMVKMFVYMFSGFCAAIVGLIISSELMASHPATGESFELNAIAAAVLGGTSMSGGRGTIGGTIVGAFVIGILSDGLVMMGVSSFWQMVIKGLVIIVAVVVDQTQRRLQSRVTLMQMAKAG